MVFQLRMQSCWYYSHSNAHRLYPPSNLSRNTVSSKEWERETEAETEKAPLAAMRDGTREEPRIEGVNSDELQGCPKPHTSTAIGTNSTTVPGAQFRRWIRRYCRWHCNWLPNESPTSPKSSEVTPCGIGTTAPSVWETGSPREISPLRRKIMTNKLKRKLRAMMMIAKIRDPCMNVNVEIAITSIAT